jgi:tetraprenyl-beta-curcumene synthase
VSREIAVWRQRALLIPDPALREVALGTLRSKRAHIVGAGLFWILPPRRHPDLLRLLVAFEIILEFLDDAHERGGGAANGLQLHRALVEALDPWTPLSDYYRLHPWKRDGGYLRALVQSCREVCLLLPSYRHVRAALLSSAGRCGRVQSLNHQVRQGDGEVALRAWAQAELRGGVADAAWWELAAAASSSLGIHALLALAAQPDGEHTARVHAAYMPWVCAVSTLLDSYVDERADLAGGRHSYLAHYPSSERALARLHELIGRAAAESAGLRDGHRHAVIAACMIAMYLSNDSARTPARRAASRRLARAGGSLTRLLVPVLRTWWLANAQLAT